MKINKKGVLFFLISLIALFVTVLGGVKGYAYFTFLNDAPYDVLISDVSSNSVVVSWKTKSEKPSLIKIGHMTFGDETPSTMHRVKLSDLREYSDYKFSINDNKNNWNKSYKGNTSSITGFTVNSDFVFRTGKTFEEVLLPMEEEVNTEAYTLVYVALFDKNSGEYSSVKTVYTNRFGGAVIDKNEFYNYEREIFVKRFPDSSLKTIEYNEEETIKANLPSLISSISAAGINCNQQRSAQSSTAIGKDAFTDLATRWVAGRGKNYASECYNDVIYRAKSEGVDPAFALTIWLNESGASNYTQSPTNSGIIEDFGIHGNPSVPPQDFNAQISHFLSLKHSASCPGLSYWEAWGNMYRWGSCNENDAVKRQQGIDYYKSINSVYGLVTNGKSLPGKINGLPKDGGDGSGEGSGTGWGSDKGPLCCALKLDNKENLRGDYENESEGKTCADIWKAGRSVYGGKLEYAVEVPGKVENACEVEYAGVCCTTNQGVFWYPQVTCTNPIASIKSAKECKEFGNVKACFLRDGKYKWLPKAIGTDFVQGVTTESSCNARNTIKTYKVKLNKGINLLGLDFAPANNVNSLLASELLAKNENIILIGKFTNNTWSHLVKKSEKLPFAGEDFILEQNNGYLIISLKDIELTLNGWKDSGATYKELTKGWNLVGGSIYTGKGSASRVLDSLTQNGFDVDTVSRWDTDLGHFLYRKEGTDQQEYGDDFRITSTDGLFIKKTK